MMEFTMNDARSMDACDVLVSCCHKASLEGGWWNPEDIREVRDGTRLGKLIISQKLALIHSEVSEALEGVRKGQKDDHITHRMSVDVELADAVIRIMDLAGAMGIDLGTALAAKMAYNRERADHKPEARAAAGGKAF